MRLALTVPSFAGLSGASRSANGSPRMSFIVLLHGDQG